ncbi:MAG: DNA polymerase V [Alphaproteobacteria bacterium CG_4_10_14_0_8_um_filter_53_9]|nr:MAG: DNA polymerase V [Alphaproteobacteria bacterium CG_4_10_14_0_8_um_filter_53_9]
MKTKSVTPLTKKAGRPKGTGRYGEATKVMRVPERLADKLQQLLQHEGFERLTTEPVVPLFGGRVQAGTAVSTDEFVEAQLNLHSHLVQRPDSTFFVRAQGQSMIGVGIYDGDLLVVDRSLTARNGNIVVAAVDGALTVKRLEKMGEEKVLLLPENPSYPAIEVTGDMSFEIWGVVTSVVHEFGARFN